MLLPRVTQVQTLPRQSSTAPAPKPTQDPKIRSINHEAMPGEGRPARAVLWRTGMRQGEEDGQFTGRRHQRGSTHPMALVFSFQPWLVPSGALDDTERVTTLQTLKLAGHSREGRPPGAPSRCVRSQGETS